jgi:hypothetical protein
MLKNNKRLTINGSQDRALVELGVREDPQKLEYALVKIDELTKANAELMENLRRTREELLCIKQRRD